MKIILTLAITLLGIACWLLVRELHSVEIISCYPTLAIKGAIMFGAPAAMFFIWRLKDDT